mgnify:CR=1 FL=1
MHDVGQTAGPYTWVMTGAWQDYSHDSSRRHVHLGMECVGVRRRGNGAVTGACTPSVSACTCSSWSASCPAAIISCGPFYTVWFCKSNALTFIAHSRGLDRLLRSRSTPQCAASSAVAASGASRGCSGSGTSS